MAQITLNSSGVASNGTLALQSNGTTTAVTIDASQNVGIGTTSPTKRLQVESGSTATGGQAWSHSAGTVYARIGIVNPGTSNDTEFGTVSNNDLRLITSNTERARIDSSGNLGIGNTSPDSKLVVEGGSGTYAQIKDGTVNTFIQARSADSSGVVGTITNHALAFYTNSTEKARITSSGDLLVGTTTSKSKLTLNGTQTFVEGADARVGTIKFASGGFNITSSETELNLVTPYSSIVFFTGAAGTTSERARIGTDGTFFMGTTNSDPSGNSVDGFVYRNDVKALTANRVGGNVFFIGRSSTTGAIFTIRYNGADVGTISTNGSSTAYNTTSDYRLKEAVAPMTNALATVTALKPVTYKWKADGSNGQGFIAHELQSVVPDAVFGEKDAVDADGKPVYQGIDTSFLVATLTAAIQELKAEFDAYKASHP